MYRHRYTMCGRSGYILYTLVHVLRMMSRRSHSLSRRLTAATDLWPEHPGGVLLLLVIFFLPARILLGPSSDVITACALVGWLCIQVQVRFPAGVCRTCGMLAAGAFVCASLLGGEVPPAAPPPPPAATDGRYHELELCSEGGTKLKSFETFSLRGDDSEMGTACPVTTVGTSATMLELSTPTELASQSAYRLVLLLATGQYARGSLAVRDASGVVRVRNVSFEVGPNEDLPWDVADGTGATSALTATASAVGTASTRISLSPQTFDASSRRLATATAGAADAAAGVVSHHPPDANRRRLKGGSLGGFGGRSGRGSFSSPFRGASTASAPVAHGMPVAHGYIPGTGSTRFGTGHSAQGAVGAYGRPVHSFGGGMPHRYGGGYPNLGDPAYYTPSLAHEMALGFTVAHTLHYHHNHHHLLHRPHAPLPGAHSGSDGGGIMHEAGDKAGDKAGSSSSLPVLEGTPVPFLHGPHAWVRGQTLSTYHRQQPLSRPLATDYDRYVLLEPLLRTLPAARPPPAQHAPTAAPTAAAAAAATTTTAAAGTAAMGHPIPFDGSLKIHMQMQVFVPASAGDGSGPPVPLVGFRAVSPPSRRAIGLTAMLRGALLEGAYWLMALLLSVSLLGFERASRDGSGGGPGSSHGGTGSSAETPAATRLIGGGATSSDEEEGRVEALHTLYPSLSAGGGRAGNAAPSGGPPVLADGELAYVGCRVQTQWTRDEGGDDGWYAATIVRMQGQRATLHYDDGDMWTGGLDEMFTLRGDEDPPTLPQASHPPVAVGVPIR